MSDKYPSSQSAGWNTTTPKSAVFKEVKTYYIDYVEDLEATADRQRRLMLKQDKKIKVCQFCYRHLKCLPNHAR